MGSAIDPAEIKRVELTEVYSHPEAQVDIILVHGLNGDPRNTWTSKKNNTFWPTDLLPVTLKGVKARILVYGYNADVYAFGKGGPSSDMIYQHAQTLLVNLALERDMEDATNHPIIWIAHSLGGILVKRALNLSQSLENNNADDWRSIYISTYGIMFLGTPHTGSDSAKWGLMLQRMVNALIPKKVLHSENQMVKTLQTNNEILQEINLKFLEIYPKFQICMAHEGLETDLKGTKTFIVDQTSASPMLPGVAYFGIEATHSGMCKFDSKNSPGYGNVAGSVKKWVDASPPVIEARRVKEREDRLRSRQQQASELFPHYGQTAKQPSTGGNTPDPAGSVNSSTIIIKPNFSIPPQPIEQELPDQLFIKPSLFRPNSIFVGRQTELEEMHRMLFDRKRRADGTSAVLIQSLPGGGKTHLAREYVFLHREDYPGGIFWLRAKSTDELALGYWDIAKKTVFKETANKEDFSRNDPQQFIKMVKKWLNHRQEWLLVFDGIHFGDIDGLTQFIPDNKNTSIIYTSTEKAVSGDHHFMNPQVIRLPALSAREAQSLLLLELAKREPFQKDDLKYSMELVQAMGFLPIVIHTVAQRLKMTDEPLSKFARSYAAEPRLRGLGTYKAVVEQLEEMGAREALNLINILAFFSQHIPVEMISLGLRILDIPVKAFDAVTGRSLNNTFRFLNMFALVDRNETREHSIHSSQSSKGSRNMLAENVDVIRLHGVVQGFFIDTMNGDESLPHWLSRAVGVFCCSYDSASSRIESKTNAGLVEDYRLYEIHGNRLKHHILRYEKRYHMLDEAHHYLDLSLEKIKYEIEQRTPESSQTIAGGRSDAFQTSIFDRTSSSSDTGPETPKHENNDRTLRIGPQPPWFEQGHLESPSSLTHDTEYQRHHQQSYDARPYEVMPDGPKNNQLLLPQSEEGYESDMEGSVAMTIQPSQRTIHQQEESSPISPGSVGWTKVERRPRKPERLDLHQHRTIKRMESQRYRDRAGSFRAVSALDPRISHETAQGHFQSSSSRAESRGRISGQSSAEVALTQISQTSPPPARGRGKIRDRSSSQRPETRRVRSGIASYASAVIGPTNDTIPGFQQILRPTTGDTSTESVCGSAVTSLQRFPVNIVEPSSPRSQFTPMPPYPPSPGVERQDLFAHSDPNLFNFPDHFDIPMRDAQPRQDENESFSQNTGFRQDNLKPAYPTKIYPRMTGPVPVETRARSASGPLKRDLPHEYSSWHSQGYPDQVPSSMSISSPNIRPSESLYYPGRPELSFSSTPGRFDGGYTSQPMSRDPSGQSTQSNRSRNGMDRGRGRRRPSVAETEPMPSLPTFSPKIPPTSYRVYTQKTEQQDFQGRRERERSPGGWPARKSPRLGYASHVSEESLERWDGGAENLPPPRRTNFNPQTPAFTPSTSQPPSLFSTRAHSTTAANLQKRTSPIQHQGPYSAPQSKVSSAHHSPIAGGNCNTSTRTSPHPLRDSQFAPPPLPVHRTSPPHHPLKHQVPVSPVPRSFTALDKPEGSGSGSGEGMGSGIGTERGGSGSGGVHVGHGRVIEFGDFPEKVDVEGARERVERTWVERRESGLRERNEGNKGKGVGLGIGIERR